MTTRILVGIDLSDSSDEALRQAYDRADHGGGALAVCHVLPDLSDTRHLLPFTNSPTRAHFAALEADARRAIQEHVARVIPNARAEIFVEWGREYAQLIRKAEAWHADLVVVGSRGSTGLSRLLLGSVAELVVRHSQCTVLVARSVSSHGVVMAATDLSDASMPAVAAAAREAERLNARLVVIHVLDFTSIGMRAALSAPFAASPVLPSADTVREIRATLERALRDTLSNMMIKADSLVLEGPPVAAIAHHAMNIGADLLVVGTHGRTGLLRIALGSVAARVVRLAHCSVLTVRMSADSTRTLGEDTGP